MNKIYIIDCEWLRDPPIKNSFLSWKAMKISSYYKQKGNQVVLAKKKEEFMRYDKLYIIRELFDTPLPATLYLDDEKAILLGDAFVGWLGYTEFPLTFSVVRPDYLLYNLDYTERNKYYYSTFLQYMSGSFILSKKQDASSSFSRHYRFNVVVDSQIWRIKDDEALHAILTDVALYQNVVFLYGIDLQRILSSESLQRVFKHIQLASKYKHTITYRNTGDPAAISKLFAFFRDWKYYRYCKPFGYKMIVQDHWLNFELAKEDLWRAFEMMLLAKQYQIRINLRMPKGKYSTPYHEYFQLLKYWSNYSYKLSFIEAMTKPASIKTGKTAEELIYIPSNWVSKRVRILVYLLTDFPEQMNKYALLEWGDTVYDFHLDMDKLQENKLYDTIL